MQLGERQPRPQAWGAPLTPDLPFHCQGDAGAGGVSGSAERRLKSIINIGIYLFKERRKGRVKNKVNQKMMQRRAPVPPLPSQQGEEEAGGAMGRSLVQAAARMEG